MARRRARELAFRALFQADRGGADLDTVWHQVRADLGEGGDLGEEAYGDVLDADGVAFADSLVRAFREHREEVDAELTDLIEGWSFQQMSQTDLNVLRLAVTELLYLPDVPPRVTLEMAVRLAKRFGGDESGRFVNGVLGTLYRRRHPKAAAEAS
ncbi:MAG: transcription antitermination factor NusB [Trueperaceae bacterium]